MSSPPPVARALTELGVPHRVFVHPGPVHSLEQAARERGQTPDQVIRSLLFRLNQDEYVMVLIAGERQVSWPALRRHLGTNRVTMAKPDEVRAVTGYEIGAVAPFGLPQPLRVLVDDSVTAQPEVSIGSGVRDITVMLKTENLMRALGKSEVIKRTD
jgi:Cys-tRNA(Pro) deacylase